jgi:hypothetical protein
MLDQITAKADAGSGPSLTRVYDGSRPATGASIGGAVLLVEVTNDDPFAPSASSGVLSPTLTGPTTVIADGTATWFRVVDSAGTFVLDGSVGVEMSINFPDLVTSQPFEIVTWTVTAGNA